jgi:mycothiol synthase
MVNRLHALVTPAYTYRPMGPDDVPALYQLLQEIAAVEPDSYAPSLPDLQRDMADPWCDPPVDSCLAFAPDGSLAACARVWTNPELVDDVHAYTDLDVHPAHRNGTVEEPLLDWLEARGAERVRAVAAAHPGHQPMSLLLVCWDSQTELIARCERRGFHPVRYSYRMRRDLREPIPQRPLPAGLSLQPYRPELDEQWRLARNETFRDHWGFEPVSPDEWRLFFIQRSTFRPDLSFAILDGDQVVAYSFNRVDPVEGERTGFPAGWIASLGTRRVWRKRGLASALLAHSLRAFQAAGLPYAGLGVDAENTTGAVALYEHLGFRTYIRRVTLGKRISAAQGGEALEPATSIDQPAFDSRQ